MTVPLTDIPAAAIAALEAAETAFLPGSVMIAPDAFPLVRQTVGAVIGAEQIVPSGPRLEVFVERHAGEDVQLMRDPLALTVTVRKRPTWVAGAEFRTDVAVQIFGAHCAKPTERQKRMFRTALTGISAASGACPRTQAKESHFPRAKGPMVKMLQTGLTASDFEALTGQAPDAKDHRFRAWLNAKPVAGQVPFSELSIVTVAGALGILTAGALRAIRTPYLSVKGERMLKALQAAGDGFGISVYTKG